MSEFFNQKAPADGLLVKNAEWLRKTQGGVILFSFERPFAVLLLVLSSLSFAQPKENYKELFLALPIDAATKIEISKVVRDYWQKNPQQRELCQPIPAQFYHVTLDVLGATALSRVPDLVKQLNVVAKTHSVFQWPLLTMSGFSSPDANPPALVLQGKSTLELLQLYLAIDQVLLLQGFIEPIQSLIPHVTVARCKNLFPSTFPKIPLVLKPIYIGSFTLYEGERAKHEDYYINKTIADFPLQAKP